MKKLLFLLLLFSTSLVFSQYKMNYRVAPHNPIPLQYTTDHYLIYHKVKSIRYKNDNIDMLFSFDENGKSTTLDTGFGITKYDYDKNGFLKSVKTDYTNAKYKTNKDGFIIEEKYSDGSGSKYHYNEKGLFIQKDDLKTGSIIERYAYDSLGRATSAIFYDKNTGATSQSSVYSYQDIATHTVISESLTDAYGNTSNNTYYYTKRGELLSSDYKNDVITLDKKSNPISHYKSTEDVTITFDITYY
jgi:YD repeat-containing protein